MCMHGLFVGFYRTCMHEVVVDWYQTHKSGTNQPTSPADTARMYKSKPVDTHPGIRKQSTWVSIYVCHVVHTMV